MSNRQFAVDNWFSNAKQSQQLESTQSELAKAQAEIQALTIQIENLRSEQFSSQELEQSIVHLREQLETQSGMQSIPIEIIKPNPNQPRQTFLPESIEAMSLSLDKEGQLNPVILIETENDYYLLLDGERRWRGAKRLNWQFLNAVIIQSPQDLHRKALLTSLHREDLNPLDKAEAILFQIASQTSVDSQEIPRILSTTIRRFNKKKQIFQLTNLLPEHNKQQQKQLEELELNSQEQSILAVLLDLQLNPASIDANIFPMLSLSKDLKQAIRLRGLKGSHAMALQTLNAKNLGLSTQKSTSIREQATQQVLTEHLSATQTRKLVKEIRAKYKGDSTPNKTVKQITSVLQKLTRQTIGTTSDEQLKQLKNLLESKLVEIEEILQT